MLDNNKVNKYKKQNRINEKIDIYDVKYINMQLKEMIFIMDHLFYIV